MVNVKKKQKKFRRKAQSFLEYSILICCMVAAIIGLQIFLKRSIQGKLREAADGLGGQYDPQRARTDITTEVNPINIVAQPKPVWLRYPANTTDKEGKDISGQYIIDSYDLPVFGIETTTTYSETVQKSGKEEMDKFEASLF